MTTSGEEMALPGSTEREQATVALRGVAVRAGRYVEGGGIRGDQARRAMQSLGAALGLPKRLSVSVAAAGIREGRQHVRYPQPNDPPWGHAAKREVVERLEVELLAWGFTTRADQTRSKLIAAFLIAAKQAGKDLMSMSVRQWAEEANCSRGTISTYSELHVPWLVPVATFAVRSGKPTLWLVGCAPIAARSTDQVCPGFDVSDVTPGQTLRLPRRGSLAAPSQDFLYGSSQRWRVFMSLDPDDGPFEVKHLATQAHATSATTLKHLHSFEDLGFVERVDYRHWVALPGAGDPEALAAVKPRSKERKLKHLIDREAFFNQRDIQVDPETGEITELD